MKEKTVPPNVDFRAFCFSDNGIKQAHIAEKLDVSRALVNQWAKGIKQPSRKDAVKLEEITGIAADRWPRVGATVDSPAIKALREFADRRHLSLAGLSRVVHIHERNMSRYFNGHMPPEKKIAQINDVLATRFRSRDFEVRT